MALVCTGVEPALQKSSDRPPEGVCDTSSARPSSPIGQVRPVPDHFFGQVCFLPCPFFSFLLIFSLCLPLIYSISHNLLMQFSIPLVARVTNRPT